MCEVENNVRVSVKGPKEEIETYIQWLKCTQEYQLKSGFGKNIPASKLSLTLQKIHGSFLVPILSIKLKLFIVGISKN